MSLSNNHLQVQLRKWSPSSSLKLDVDNSYQDDVEDKSSDSEDEKICEEIEETYDENVLHRLLNMIKNKTTSDLKCHKCGRISKSLCYHKRHVLSHFYKVFDNVLPNSRPFLCPICNKCSRDKTTLIRHYVFGHKTVYEVKDYCSKEVSIVSIVSSSDGECERKDTIRSSKCPKCDRKFKMKSFLRTHALSHYYQVFYDVLPDSHPFQCPICGKKNQSRVMLVRHYAFVHRKVFQLTDLTPEEIQFSVNHMVIGEDSSESDKRLTKLLSPHVYQGNSSSNSNA